MKKYKEPSIYTISAVSLAEYIGPRCQDYGYVTMESKRQSMLAPNNDREVVICKIVQEEKKTNIVTVV